MDVGRSDLTLNLNQGGSWAGFALCGVDQDADGALRLAALPALTTPAPAWLAELSEPSGPAGITVTPEGDVFFSDPDRHLVLWLDRCDPQTRPLPCLGGEGDAATRFRQPRGLLYHRERHALLVADSGNGRIQVFDAATRQFRGFWSGDGSWLTPVALAGDADGHVYVADAGARRVVKLDATGQEQADFWETLRPGVPDPAAFLPTALAIDPGEPSTLFVLDGSGWVLICARDGTVRDCISTSPATRPSGLAVSGGSIYLGDNLTRRVLRFRLGGELVGEAVGYEGPVAALAMDHAGKLLVHPGASHAPLQLDPASAVVEVGGLAAGPFRSARSRRQQRHWVRAFLDPLPEGTSAQIYLFRRNAATPPVEPPPMACGSARLFADPRWQQMPVAPNATETLFTGCAEDEFWIGVELRSTGRGTPALRQIQLEFDHTTLVAHLPAIYREGEDEGDFLHRFLTLFESAFDDGDRQIAGQASLCDPWAAPERFLPWLGSWLAETPRGDWPLARRREAVATAFDRAGMRGTAAGLRRALREEAGIEAVIEEPIVQAQWWALPADDLEAPDAERSLLGFTTGLAAAEPQGAVLDATATLDASHLIAANEYGAPLFGDLAHRVTIHIYQGRTYSEETVAEIHEIVAREKPAHVGHQVCVVEPRMRIGFQNRVGIDTIIAAPSPPDLLSQTGTTAGLRLGGEPPGRIGAGEIGQTTRLGG